MSSALRELPALLSQLGITEADLAVFSEQEISTSLQAEGIIKAPEIARVKNAWREQRQRSGVLLIPLSSRSCFEFVFFLLFPHVRVCYSFLISVVNICFLLFSIAFLWILVYSSAAQPQPPPGLLFLLVFLPPF
jgi:hypothetical protein